MFVHTSWLDCTVVFSSRSKLTADVQHLHLRGFAHAAVCKLLNFYIFQASEHDLGGSESYQPA